MAPRPAALLLRVALGPACEPSRPRHTHTESPTWWWLGLSCLVAGAHGAQNWRDWRSGTVSWSGRRGLDSVAAPEAWSPICGTGMLGEHVCGGLSSAPQSPSVRGL